MPSTDATSSALAAAGATAVAATGVAGAGAGAEAMVQAPSAPSNAMVIKAAKVRFEFICSWSVSAEDSPSVRQNACANLTRLEGTWRTDGWPATRRRPRTGVQYAA